MGGGWGEDLKNKIKKYIVESLVLIKYVVVCCVRVSDKLKDKIG